MSIEGLSSQWLDELESYTWKYLSRKHGTKKATAAIISLEDVAGDIGFRADGIFELPSGSGTLALYMARFCVRTFISNPVIYGLNIETLPEATFCLPSFLLAAYPKNIETGRFRDHNCGECAGDVTGDEKYFSPPHAAFAGLGIMMMSVTRQILDPMASDQETIKIADERFLAIID